MAGASLSALVLAAPALANKWDPSLDGVGRAGSDNGGGALDLLVPLYQDDDTLLFGNAMGGLDSDSSTGAALGLGLRLQIDESVIVGGFAYGDWLRTQNDNAFFQVTGGLEVMTEDWDLRVIGYLPLTSERTVAYSAPVDGVAGAGGIGVGTGTLAVQGNELGIQWEGVAGSLGVDGHHEREALLGGFEGEIGYKLPLDSALGRNWEVRTFLGGYHFSAEDYDTYAGPRARIELRGYDLAFMGDGARVTLGAEASWDDPRGVTGAGLLRVRIPLGWFTNERKALTALDRRMVDPIPRRITPLTDERTTTLDAVDGSLGGGAFEAVESLRTGNDAMTGHEITTIYFVSGGGTAGDAGTADDPTSLANAIAAAGTGGLVVVLGGAGDVTGSSELLGNQILIGGATTIAVQGVTTATAVTFDAADFVAAGLATRPTIVSDVASGSFGVTLGSSNSTQSGTWIQGIDVALGDPADARIGLFHENSQNHLVSDVNVTGGLIAFGVDTSVGGTSNVSNIRFENIGTDGSGTAFYAVNNTGAGTLSGIEVENATFANFGTGVGTAIQVSSGNTEVVSDVTFNNITITGASANGMQFANARDITITNVSMTSSGAPGNGLIFQTSVNDNNQDITVDNVTITGFGIGLRLDQVLDGSFTDLTIVNSRQIGIELNSSTNVTLGGGSITGTGTAMATGDEALRVVNSNNITVTNIAIDGETSGGTQVTDRAFTVTGTLGPGSVTINSAGSTGNTTTNIAADCVNPLPANVTGAISYDDLDDGAGVVTCP